MVNRAVLWSKFLLLVISAFCAGLLLAGLLSQRTIEVEGYGWTIRVKEYSKPGVIKSGR
jgi:hypothetical protein